MTLHSDPPIFQQFNSQDGNALGSLPTLVCPETNARYTLWADIEDSFPGLDCLRDWSRMRLLFMIDQGDELYALIRV